MRWIETIGGPGSTVGLPVTVEEIGTWIPECLAEGIEMWLREIRHEYPSKVNATH